MSFNESCKHCRDLILVGQVLLRDDPAGQTLEAGELQRVDLAIGDHLDEVNGPLGGRVPRVNVRSVLQKNLDDL